MDIINAAGLRHGVNSTSTSPEKPVAHRPQASNPGEVLSPQGIVAKEHKQLDQFGVVPKYHNILKELVHTERDYCKDLASIIDGYQKQLQGKLTERESEMIFGNISELQDFHNELSARVSAYVDMCPHMIGEVFVAMGLQRFMVYERYYMDHTKSLSILLQKQEDASFLGVLIRCQSRLGHQLPLADYLLKPVQRLLKYPLLLSEMLKAMSPESTGYASLLAAKQLLKDVADNINELKRRLDVSKYVESLQKRLLGWSGPDLVTFGQLKDAGDFKVSDASNKKSNRQVLLFEYGILICKPRSAGFVSVKHYFKMDDLYLQTMLNEQLCFRLTVADNKKVYFTFYCKTQDDKQYWIAKIKKVIIDFHTGIGRRTREEAHMLPNARHRPSDVPAAKPPIAPKPKVKVVAKADLAEHHRRLFSRPGPRKRFSAADSLGMASMDHAPVSKKKEDDLVLNYNPYAQAGGFTGEKQEVKQFLRRQTSARVSRKLERRRHSHQVESVSERQKRDSATSDTGSLGATTSAASRPCPSTQSDGSGVLGDGAGGWSNSHRCSTASDGKDTPLLDVEGAHSHRISTASDSSGGSCSDRHSALSVGSLHRGTPTADVGGTTQTPGRTSADAVGPGDCDVAPKPRPPPFSVTVDDHDDDMPTPTAPAELAFPLPPTDRTMVASHHPPPSAKQAGKARRVAGNDCGSADEAVVTAVAAPSLQRGAVCRDEACVVRVSFPDATHASVIVKAGDTVRKAFALRLVRRGLDVAECIVQIPALPAATVDWDDEALSALHGHTCIRVTKVKSRVEVPRHSGIVRLPSGHALCLDGVGGSGVVASPAKLMPHNSLGDSTIDPAEPTVQVSPEPDDGECAKIDGDGAPTSSKTDEEDQGHGTDDCRTGAGGTHAASAQQAPESTAGSDPYDSDADDDNNTNSVHVPAGDNKLDGAPRCNEDVLSPCDGAGGGEDSALDACRDACQDVPAQSGADVPVPAAGADRAPMACAPEPCIAAGGFGPLATSSPTAQCGTPTCPPASHVSVYAPPHGPQPRCPAFRPQDTAVSSDGVQNPLLTKRLAQFDPGAPTRAGDPNSVNIRHGNEITTVRLRPRKHSAPAALTNPEKEKEGSKRVRSNGTTPPVARRRLSSSSAPVPAPRRNTISSQPTEPTTGSRQSHHTGEVVACVRRNSRINVHRWESTGDGTHVQSTQADQQPSDPPSTSTHALQGHQPPDASAAETAPGTSARGTPVTTAPTRTQPTAGPRASTDGGTVRPAHARGTRSQRPAKVRTGGTVPTPTPRQRRPKDPGDRKIKRTASQCALARRNPSLHAGAARRSSTSTTRSSPTTTTTTGKTRANRSVRAARGTTTATGNARTSGGGPTTATAARTKSSSRAVLSKVASRRPSTARAESDVSVPERTRGVSLRQPRTPRHTDV
eukprot:m.1061289 g.1061289  ORF g.1061289 m.1061289 type:complete len:1415 (+) comp24211_c0_seq1:247-4491(+)